MQVKSELLNVIICGDPNSSRVLLMKPIRQNSLHLPAFESYNWRHLWDRETKAHLSHHPLEQKHLLKWQGRKENGRWGVFPLSHIAWSLHWNHKEQPTPCCNSLAAGKDLVTGKGYGTGPIKDLGTQKSQFGNAYYLGTWPPEWNSHCVRIWGFLYRVPEEFGATEQDPNPPACHASKLWVNQSKQMGFRKSCSSSEVRLHTQGCRDVFTHKALWARKHRLRGAVLQRLEEGLFLPYEKAAVADFVCNN